MRLDKSKAALIAVFALVIVCAGSFFAVRSFNSRVKPKAAVTVTSMAPIEVSDPTEAPTDATLPTFETAEPLDTVPLSQAPEDAESDRFTTFPISTTESTTSFTLPTEDTTAYVPPAAPDTTADESQAQETIKRAAVFSDGFLGYQFNKEGNYYFTTSDPWQRNFGFNLLYDLGAPFVNFYYDTVRCKFRYQNKDWLIQFWKGQYGLVFLGAEIGVYTKPLDRDQAHYDAAADEDMLYMSMSFYRKGVERASRDYDKYWWCTAFVPGTLDSFRDRSELSMKSRITLKTAEMRDLFCASLEKNGFKKDKDFSVSGKDVYFSWG
jgi:hypothetical protein